MKSKQEYKEEFDIELKEFQINYQDILKDKKYLYLGTKGNRKNNYVAISEYKEIDQDYLYYNYSNSIYEIDLNQDNYGKKLKDCIVSVLFHQKDEPNIYFEKVHKRKNNMVNIPLYVYGKNITKGRSFEIKNVSQLLNKSFILSSKANDLVENISQKPNTPSLEDVIDGIKEFLIEKNKNYGESALKPLGIFSKLHPYGARIDEKLARIKNMNNPTDIDTTNNLVDIVGGIILILKDKGITKFN